MLLQSCTFALGDMQVLEAFTTMHTYLCAKRSLISHAEVSTVLLQGKPQQKSHPRPSNAPANDPPPKKVRDNKNNWHPLLKAKLKWPLKQASLPTFTAIMKYCDSANHSSAVPRDGCVCSSNMFFGRCQNGLKCIKMYKLATDEEANKIIALVQKFIDKPEGLAKGQ